MVLLQSVPFRSQNGDVYFSKAFTVETRLSTSPIFVIIYFQIWYSSTDMAKKSYHVVDGHYTRYGINFMVTPNIDTQCFDNWWTLQPMENTITAAECAPVLHN